MTDSAQVVRFTPRQAISLIAFAQAMHHQDRGFRARLEHYASAHGPIDSDMLCVAAQAHYTCWYEAEFPTSVLAACRAIGSGRATAFNLCLQISPSRWDDLHQYVVATQVWMGAHRAIPDLVDTDSVKRLVAMLGALTNLRIALARVYLWNCIAHLQRHVGLSQLCPDNHLAIGQYRDYGAWYEDVDGTVYGTPEAEQAFLERQSRIIDRCPGGRDPAIQELLRRLIDGRPQSTRPACMHRFARHQEIRLASIGALAWRGNLPVDPVPREHWCSLADAMAGTLRAWAAGTTLLDQAGRTLQEALGPRTPARKELVVSFLLEPPETSAHWEWLCDDARHMRRRPIDVFA